MASLISASAIERIRAEGYLKIRLSESASAAVIAAIESAHVFFRLPHQEKLMNCLPDECGFMPMGIEYSASPAVPDAMETFRASIRTEEAAQKLKSLAARRLHRAAMAAAPHLEAIAEEFAVQLASALNGDPSNVRGAFHRWSEVQLNHALPHGSAEFINEAHEDGTFVTIACATDPGLEIQNAAGEFIPVAVAPPDIIVMPAEIATLMSGGHVLPVYHRVRRNAGFRERLTLLFNGDIDPAACVPWVRNEFNAGIDVGSRVLTNAGRFGITPFRLE